jgi:PAS domain S-box-containing protein
MDKIKVLYIDDEVGNLNAFKASFRRQFDVYTATSIDEGLKTLQTTPIEVLISDQRMPEKTGIEFFESILETFPNPIRILITAYSDIDAVIDSINKGRVYQYVTKPWDDYDLKLTIENAYNLYHLKEQNHKLTNKYQKVFTNSSDPIILFDTKGRVVDFNKAAVNFIDTKENPINQSSLSTITVNKTDATLIIDKLNKEDVFPGLECDIYGKNNEIKKCLISANKITNNYDELISYQLILKDITKRSKLNQLLLEKTIETQERERARISRDLHDGIGQSLAAIKLHFESLKIKYNQDENIKSELETIPEILQDTIHDLRRICFNTLPLVLLEYGLVKAITQLQTNISTDSFSINFNDENQFPKLTNSLEVSIFRIIQEFINNSIKHGEASEVTINLEISLNRVILNLKDNGIGFNINNLDFFKGNGLKNIQNRTDSFSGKLDMNSVINDGTEFKITLPLQIN